MESPDQVVQGPIYVLKIKSRKKDFNSEELLYSLAHKGQADLGLLIFKNIVEDANSRFCLTQKVNKGADTTWGSAWMRRLIANLRVIHCSSSTKCTHSWRLGNWHTSMRYLLAKKV